MGHVRPAWLFETTLLPDGFWRCRVYRANRKPSHWRFACLAGSERDARRRGEEWGRHQGHSTQEQTYGEE